jgi:putative endonuclease
MAWYVYIAQCNDGTLYTGITTNVARRELEHNNDNKRGAKSLRAKRPIQIVYIENCKTQDQARKRETDIKGWKRTYKLRLIKENKGLPENFR